MKGYWMYCRQCEEAVPFDKLGYNFVTWHKDCTIFDRHGRTSSKRLDYASHGKAYSTLRAVTLIPAYRARREIEEGKVHCPLSPVELLALEAG